MNADEKPDSKELRNVWQAKLQFGTFDTGAKTVEHASARPKRAHLEGAHQSLIDTHHGACIIKLATVVWRRKYGDQLPIRKKLVPILSNLQIGVPRG